MTFGSDLSTVKMQELVGRIFSSVGEIPQINWSVQSFPGNRSSATLSRIPGHACACRSLVHWSTDMRPCAGSACSVGS